MQPIVAREMEMNPPLKSDPIFDSLRLIFNVENGIRGITFAIEFASFYFYNLEEATIRY